MLHWDSTGEMRWRKPTAATDTQFCKIVAQYIFITSPQWLEFRENSSFDNPTNKQIAIWRMYILRNTSVEIQNPAVAAAYRLNLWRRG